jgi:hypothetical protein
MNMGSRNLGKALSVRRLAAVIGGSAVISLAALGVAIGPQETSGWGEQTAVANSPGMTVGGTSTETTPPAQPAKGWRATPTIKGPAPLPSEEAAAK